MPAGPRCGDKAEYEYEVDSELIGLIASVLVERENTPGLTATSQLEIEKATTTVVWPDLQKEDASYYGGRQFDPRGLDKKNYEDKFKEQKFQLTIMCIGEEKGSGDTIEIKAYDPKGPEEKKIAIPILVDFPPFRQPVFNPQTNTTESVLLPYHPKAPEAVKRMVKELNAGHFWITFRDGEVILTVKIKVVPESNAIPKEKIFADIKKSVESYWNSTTRGLRQWVFHRKDCVRGKECNCLVLYATGTDGLKLKAGGCCKVPVRLKIEEGDDNTVAVRFLTLAQRASRWFRKIVQPVEWKLPELRADSTQFFYPENRFGTYAHEIGHMLGLPDQYEGGCTSKLPGRFIIDDKSVMGRREGGGKVPEDYVTSQEFIRGWINQKLVDEMEPIKNTL